MRLTLVVILVVIISIMVTGAQRVRGGRRGGGGRGRGVGGVWPGRGRGRGRGNNRPIRGNWGQWSKYNECSVTCGVGIQKRHRICNSGARRYGGRRCWGKKQEKRSCYRSSCPVDGNWSRWYNVGICPVTCGGSFQKRRRYCSNPSPRYGGAGCKGRDKKLFKCNRQKCPVDGNWGRWYDIGDCSVTCGGGLKDRVRNCNRPAPANGGADCRGKKRGTVDCNTDHCPVDGDWGEWSNFTECSVTCGGGNKSRNRSCDSPEPAHDGLDCDSNSTETTSCNTHHCPVNGDWGEWSNFTECSVTCGGGNKSRNRSCDSPEPAHDGLDCEGNSTETVSCNSHHCPVNGDWGEWSNFTECSVTCGGGNKSRSRSCDNPEPAHDGLDCVGNNTETMPCNSHHCPVNGDWGEWSNFTECSVTCGGGNKSRNRSCDSPEPAHDGLDCEGNSTETVSCNSHHCPVNGDWGEWSNFTECSVTCGGGNKSRSRSCDNPEPAHDGLDCVGNNTETMPCNSHHCPVNGDWGEWSNFTECSVTCGGGNKSRIRSCDSPEPAHDGLDCDGNSTETMSCNSHHCPVNGDWGEWSNFTECSVTCGGGNKSRSRSCDNPEPAHDGLDCVGNNTETMPCNSHHCPVNGSWGEWSNFTECSVTCGGGNKSRNRSCDSPEPAHDGLDCDGNSTETISCNSHHCPVNGDWGEWSNFTECSVTCGGGNKFRDRSCDSPEPAHDGLDCDGSSTETISCNSHHCPGSWYRISECSVTCGGGLLTIRRNCKDCTGGNEKKVSCNVHNCPVDGDWGEWSNFTECSVTCGGGNKSRSRSCDNPEPAHDGLDCDGNNTETMSCNSHHCPVNGSWGEWSNFTECSVTCGGGNKSRNRSCDNPEPAHDGLDCDGNSTETMSCNTHNCPEPDLEPCLDEECGNHGFYVDGRCKCNPGFTGSMCEIDLCADNTCGNPDGCCRVRPVPESPDCGETCVGRQQLNCIYTNCHAYVCNDGLSTCYDPCESSCVLSCSESAEM